MDKNVSKIKLFRAEPGKENSLLKELNPEITAYNDKTIQPKTTYFYTIITEDNNGRQCKYPASIGIRSNE